VTITPWYQTENEERGTRNRKTGTENEELETRNEDRIAHDRWLIARSQNERERTTGENIKTLPIRWRHTV